MNEPFNKQAEPWPPGHDERWARNLITEVAFAHMVEKRRARRWSIFFKFLFLAYLVVILLLLFWPLGMAEMGIGKRHTALVNVEGLIAGSTDASAANVIAGLRKAFEDRATVGVILRINSPGGSPVQAGEMYDEIMRLRKLHPTIPVYAVADDVCASGGYYVAAAAQKIYANKASIIGSIGVRADGFGFVDALQKLGISHRLYTAGQNKAFLDPFEPVRPEDVHHLQGILDEVHQQFIKAVRQGRGERLRGEDPELFSGLVWTGEKGVELGLVDELADARYVAEMVIGAKEIVDYTNRPSLLKRLSTGVEAGLERTLERVLGAQDGVSLR